MLESAGRIAMSLKRRRSDPVTACILSLCIAVSVVQAQIDSTVAASEGNATITQFPYALMYFIVVLKLYSDS